MSDRELQQEVLNQLINACRTIVKRFSDISSAEDFCINEQGLLLLDSICMQLIVIGEKLKKLDRMTSGVLLVRYKQVDWKKAMAMRDVISHNYSSVDEEIVFEVCRYKIPVMLESLKQIKNDPQSK